MSTNRIPTPEEEKIATLQADLLEWKGKYSQAKGVIELLQSDLTALRQRLADVEVTLATIQEAAEIDARDLATPRDGTKLTRAELIQIIAFLQEATQRYQTTFKRVSGEKDDLRQQLTAALAQVGALRRDGEKAREDKRLLLLAVDTLLKEFNGPRATELRKRFAAISAAPKG
jgi:chromosome segregation ATPase